MHGDYNIHFADEGYKTVLLSAIENTHSRLLLETMGLDHIGDMDQIITATLAACRRGVEVTVVYDRYSYINNLTSGGPRQLLTFKDRLNELEQTGVLLRKVGERKANPFAGRHHAKAVVADSTIFVGGGINLTSSSFQTKDFMMEFESNDLAELLYKNLPTIAATRLKDEVIYDDGINRLLIDGGRSHQSLIYETVCSLAKQARRAWYISKLAPDKRLRDLLEQIDSSYIYNRPSTASLFDRMAITIDQQLYPVKNSYTAQRLLHAKFCIFEMPEGHFELVTGSHNFNSRGVDFGTQEIAIHSKDQNFSLNLLNFAASLSDNFQR